MDDDGVTETLDTTGTEGQAFDLGTVMGADGKVTGDDWYTKLAPETVEKIGDNKHLSKMTSLDHMATELVELSKLKGRPALPPPDASDEEWDKVFAAAGGVPEGDDGYGLSLDGVKDDAFRRTLQESGYLDRLEKTMKRAGVPARLAVKIANASLDESRSSYDAYHADRKERHDALVKSFGSEDAYTKRFEGGMEALGRIYGGDDAGRDALLDHLTAAGLRDHPVVVDLLSRLNEKISPGKIVLGGATGPARPPDALTELLPMTARAIRQRTG